MAPPRLAFAAFAAGALLHTAAALVLWRGWEPGLRGMWLVYVDLPLSLLWLHLPGRSLLAWSLVVGGLYWGAVTAVLTALVGRLTRGRRR